MKVGVSVIIPAFGHQELLNQSLDTWAKQTVAADQIIVVDDGSTPPLTVPKGVELVRIEREMVHRGSSAAKNLGAAHAIGNYLVFADASMLVMPETIESLLKTFEEFAEEGRHMVLLNVLRVGLARTYTADETKDMRAFLKKTRQQDDIAKLEDMATNAFCYEQCVGALPAALFWNIGGYDEKAHPSWGYNNHSLTLEVVKHFGHASSNIRRAGSAFRLLCFHNFHEAPADQTVAKAEFKAKWGKEWTKDMLTEVRDAARASQNQPRLQQKSS